MSGVREVRVYFNYVITLYMKTVIIQKMLVSSASHVMHYVSIFNKLLTIVFPSAPLVPLNLTLLPVGRGDSVFEGGDGSVELCVEVISGTVSSVITIVISTGGPGK